MGLLAKITGKAPAPKIADDDIDAMTKEQFATTFGHLVADAGPEVQQQISESEQAASPKPRKARPQIRTERFSARLDPKVKAALEALALDRGGKGANDGLHFAVEMLASAGLIPHLTGGDDD